MAGIVSTNAVRVPPTPVVEPISGDVGAQLEQDMNAGPLEYER